MEIVEELIQEELEILDEVIAEEVEVLDHMGNPEKLIGKPYDAWTPEDIQTLAMVYGTEASTGGKPNPLTRLIVSKEWDKLQKAKQAVEEM